MSTIDSLAIFDESVENGFSEQQSRHLVHIAEQITRDTRFEVNALKDCLPSIRADIGEIKLDLTSVKSSIQILDTKLCFLEKMLYSLGAIMVAGFGLIIYLVKG
jgi:hypothetical protein